MSNKYDIIPILVAIWLIVIGLGMAWLGLFVTFGHSLGAGSCHCDLRALRNDHPLRNPAR